MNHREKPALLDLTGAWGYCAVVVSKDCYWQGLKVPDPKGMTLWITHAENLAKFRFQSQGINASEDQIFGALQAALAECVQQIPADPHMESRAGIFASAIAKRSGERFWVVDVTEQDERGTGTRFTVLDANTAEDARREIEARIAPLKLGLFIKLAGMGERK